MRFDIYNFRKQEMLNEGITLKNAEISLKAQDLWEKEHESWIQRYIFPIKETYFWSTK